MRLIGCKDGDMLTARDAMMEFHTRAVTDRTAAEVLFARWGVRQSGSRSKTGRFFHPRRGSFVRTRQTPLVHPLLMRSANPPGKLRNVEDISDDA